MDNSGKMEEYKSALDRLRKGEDESGDSIWIEEMGTTGKPNIFYRYDSNGRLMKYARILYGYSIMPAEYTRFGEQTQIEVEKRRRTYHELR